MHIIEVIPLQKGVSIDSLTYYSSFAYPLGTILQIPIRKRELPGIVIGVKPVSTVKSALRSATFSLKKLPVQMDAPALPASVIETARSVSTYIPAHVGSVIYAMLPADIKTGVRIYPKVTTYTAAETPLPAVLTETKHNRFISYRSNIRQNFAHSGSVLFVVPTAAAVTQAQKLLETGIEKRVVTFSSTHTKRQLDASYTSFEDLSHAKLIIATPNYAFLDRHDITTIIVEQSGSSQYRARTRPYLDMREVLKTYAHISGREIILGDILPCAEDEHARREERYATYEEHAKRLQIESQIQICEHTKKEDDGYSFSILTDELKETIARTIANRGNVFLYASRRGIAPLVLCNDCGHIFRCPDSGAPYTLLREGNGDTEKRWFYSATSGKRVRAADTCPDCTSWRLREQGIGIQQVYEVMQENFPDLELFLFDHTTANTHTKAQKILGAFYASKKGVLIGTTMALPYITQPVACTGIISYEALRAVPTWRADETVLSLLLHLRELTTKDVMVQTRSEVDEILTFAKKGHTDAFYTEELAVRESLGYPPFATFVLLSWTGNKEQVVEVEETITQALPECGLQCYSAPHASGEKTVRHGLIRLPEGQYPNVALVDALRNLPPYIKVEVNPERIV